MPRETNFPDPLSRSVLRDDLSRQNRRDDFTFTLFKPTKFRAALKGIQKGANVDLFLRNDSNKVIAKSKKKGRKNEKLKINELDAGTYTVSAKLKGKNPTKYKLRFRNKTIIPNDFAGNDTATARPIAVGPNNSIFTDFVDADDPSDFYEFSVGSASSPSASLNIKATGTAGPLLDDDVKVILRDSSGSQITSFSTSNAGEASSTEIVERGTYFIEVQPRFSSDSTKYNLELSARSIPDTAGETLGTARTVGVNTASNPIEEFVGTGDATDLYKFTVGSVASPSARFKATVSGIDGALMEDDVQLTLRDSLGNKVSSVDTLGNNGGGETLDRTIGQGTYYLEVEPRFSNDNAGYTIDLTADTIPDSAGETLATARALTVGTTPTTINEFVGEGDTDDYYSFSVSTPKTLNLTATGLNGELFTGAVRFTVRDSLNSEVSSSRISAFEGNGGKTVNPILEPGTYFVHVSQLFSSSTDVNYTLQLSTS